MIKIVLSGIGVSIILAILFYFKKSNSSAGRIYEQALKDDRNLHQGPRIVNIRKNGENPQNSNFILKQKEKSAQKLKRHLGIDRNKGMK